MRIKFLLMIAVCSTLKCGFAAAAEPLAEIYNPDPAQTDPWADISLHINSINCDAGHHQCAVRAQGLYRGKPVGLEVVIGAQKNNRRGVSYRSTGVESDALLAALSELYKSRAQTKAFHADAFADAELLQGDLARIKDEPIKIRVVFNADGPEAKYAELYTNIIPDRRVLEINEKDEAFRKQILEALAQ
ncbi:MAG: hypothetical protein JWM78_1208 [Verrucomicrobiaceae bacterium]|nr:hypothetical protein [Verrucomicrobiaceae bacterium]